KDDHDPARMALASLPARKRARRMVPQARRHLGWTHAADRHCGHGTQAAHRALALCRNGDTSRRCRNPPRERSSRVKEQELSVAICRRRYGERDRSLLWTHNTSAFQVGRVSPGLRLMHEAFWCGLSEWPDRM